MLITLIKTRANIRNYQQKVVQNPGRISYQQKVYEIL